MALVNTIPDTSLWKPILTFASPTIAVAISALWVFATRQLDDWLADRKIDAELKKAEATLQQIEADPRSSAQAKQKAQDALDSLRLLKLSLHSRRVQAVINA